MTIIEALVQLRNDLKLWVTNNLRVKMDKNLGAEKSGEFLFVNTDGNIETTDIATLQELIGEGFEAVSNETIDTLFVE